ncbi:MAG TPA: AMP-binding protein [bacterium]|nr:AMP-binding protein [bacterium]
MSDFKIINMTLGQLLDKQAKEYPDTEAIVFADRNFRLTYRQFKNEADKLAKGLIAVGVKKGNHVAVWAQNVPHWIIFMFAIAKIGAVMLTINTGYKSRELEYVLKQSDSTVLALTDGLKQNDFLEIVYGLVPELKSQPRGYLKSKNFPFLQKVVFIGQEKHRGMYNLNEITALGESIVSDEEFEQRQKSLNPDDVVNMQYTSGTTGFPKGVMLTHINILNNGYWLGENMKYTHKDRLCLPVPLFHCFGCVLGVMAVTTHASTIIPLETFNPLMALATVQKERCTAIYGVPTMFISELNLPMFDMFDLKSLRTGIMAGSVCPVSVMKDVITKMNCSELTIVYGLTEASPGITQSSVFDSAEIRASTVGKKLPGVEVKIINPETLEELGDNQEGELCCRGYNVMKGYYNKPEETAKAFLKDGWLRTGDLAVRDSNGYFKITGRHKDIIIRGGENISPKEIEDLIYKMDGVKDVQVVAAPSKKYGEEVAAFIIKKENADITESDVKDYCKDKISRFKVPHYIAFIEAFPQTASGKIQKYKLREMCSQLFQVK